MGGLSLACVWDYLIGRLSPCMCMGLSYRRAGSACVWDYLIGRLSLACVWDYLACVWTIL